MFCRGDEHISGGPARRKRSRPSFLREHGVTRRHRGGAESRNRERAFCRRSLRDGSRRNWPSCKMSRGRSRVDAGRRSRATRLAAPRRMVGLSSCWRCRLEAFAKEPPRRCSKWFSINHARLRCRGPKRARRRVALFGPIWSYLAQDLTKLRQAHA
jgi:hypothetical protein